MRTQKQAQDKVARSAPVDDVRRVKLTNGAGNFCTVAACETRLHAERKVGVGSQFAAANAENSTVLEVEKELAAATIVHDKVAVGA
jgi:hypothetical protein